MTELIWEGKYDKDGKKKGPVRIALPFQTIETVNESAKEREKTLEMFSQGRPTEWRNRLIWGDKKYVLPSLLPEFAGKVNLIYIDPPFDTGADFSFRTTIPDNPDTPEDETTQFTKRASIIEQKAYRDTWGKGLESYLQWFYDTIIILRELLSENGSIYIHLDWHIGHYAKSIMDEILGYDNFQREIIWALETASGYKSITKNWIRQHDVIFYYTKNRDFIFNKEYLLHKPEYIARFKQKDDKGRAFRDDRPGGRKQYLDDSKGTPIGDVWSDIMSFQQASTSSEYLKYSTQKPEALLERIIKASSNEGDLVLDCFIGSGTTSAVAEKLNRRWIACDLGRFAMHTTRKRLLGISNVKPFVLQNLGKYERQQWMGAEFKDVKERAAIEQHYRNFILQLYQAEPVKGYNWLHGAKEGRMIHIGSVDSPVAIGDVKNIVQEFWKTVGKSKKITVNGVDILGWEFAFEINETAKQFAAANNVDIKFKKIPTEVLEKRAVEQGDIKFYELASLSIKTKLKGKELTIKLSDFIVPPDDIPEEVRKNITHWQQWVDYWAVDWNYHSDTFHNVWQSYRTKKNNNIKLEVTHTYEKKGNYQVVVKVIDILGNDTTKMIDIKI